MRVHFSPLWDSLSRCANDPDTPQAAFRLTSPRRAALGECLSLLRSLSGQLGARLSQYLAHQLERTADTLALFRTGDESHVLTIHYDREGNPTLQAHSREVPGQLRQALWEGGISVVLTSGTLAAGGDFHRSQTLLGLVGDKRVKISVTPSPFPYEENCLLYLPSAPHVPMGGWREVQYLSEQLLTLVEATHGHTLVLFTSYKLMGAVYRQVKDALGFPLFEVWRNGAAAIREFKASQNGVLFAAGSCWEGMDFPGDMVSSLVLPRLPFPVPDPLSRAEQERFPSLEDYLREVILPDMQVKLRQGFGPGHPQRDGHLRGVTAGPAGSAGREVSPGCAGGAASRAGDQRYFHNHRVYTIPETTKLFPIGRELPWNSYCAKSSTLSHSPC